MNPKELRCVNCGNSHPIGIQYYCAKCESPLEVIYSDGELPADLELSNKLGIWKYDAFLPEILDEHKISLGEGQTPLLRASKIGSDQDLSNVYLKCEGVNPTGSFKDRPTCLGTAMAMSFGVSTVAVSSTGNAGASLSAYAARAGLRAVVFVSSGTPSSKIIQMYLHGAKIIPVNGSLSDAYWFAYRASKELGWMNLTSTFLSAYTVEGDKTVAYELFQQLQTVPDYVIVPVSVGPLAVGIYKGFKELMEIGLVEKLPILVAAQSEKCAPIVDAFESGDLEVHAWEGDTQTIAGGIADPLHGYSEDGTYTLRIIRESGGCAIKVTDAEVIQATNQLSGLEGVYSEPTGAVSVAALRKLAMLVGLHKEDLIVCMITGHGLKQQVIGQEDIILPQAIEPELGELERLLAQ